MAARDLLPLFRQIRIVQLLNLLGDSQSGVTPRDDFGAQKPGTSKDLLGHRPIEERIECLPVVIELPLEAANLLGVRPSQCAQVRKGGDVALAELGQTLAVFRCSLARDVEKIVPDENAGQIDI